MVTADWGIKPNLLRGSQPALCNAHASGCVPPWYLQHWLLRDKTNVNVTENFVNWNAQSGGNLH